MKKAVQAKLYRETDEGTLLLVRVPHERITVEISKYGNNGVMNGEIRLDDGRCITAEQRKKAYATLADIADYCGYPPEELKELMKYYFVAHTGEDYFSLGGCSITTARHFINYIIDFSLEWGMPLRETLINRTDDIDAAIYASIKHKRCIVCGGDGEIHHLDAIGMGRDRSTFDDSGLRKICLCRRHHSEAHRIGKVSFEQKYHVYGILYKE